MGPGVRAAGPLVCLFRHADSTSTPAGTKPRRSSEQWSGLECSPNPDPKAGGISLKNLPQHSCGLLALEKGEKPHYACWSMNVLD